MARTGVPVLAPDPNGLGSAIERLGLEPAGTIRVVDGVDYRTMLALQRDAAVVLTDSGGVQEESCVICTRCVTVRDTTEYGATVHAGGNELVAADAEAIRDAATRAMTSKRTWSTPKRWDKAVSDRVVRALKRGIIPLT